MLLFLFVASCISCTYLLIGNDGRVNRIDRNIFVHPKNGAIVNVGSSEMEVVCSFDNTKVILYEMLRVTLVLDRATSAGKMIDQIYVNRTEGDRFGVRFPQSGIYTLYLDGTLEGLSGDYTSDVVFLGSSTFTVEMSYR